MKKSIGIGHENLVEKRSAEDPTRTVSYQQGYAIFVLQDAVSKVLNNEVGHFRGAYEKSWYEEASRQSGISSRSLKRFLEKGGSVGQAAKILYAFGYRIAKISIEKLPE